MRILIAEDQYTSALFLRRTLERMGHEVTVAGDGEEAWDLIRGGDVPLLISDWMMPKLDGPGLCRRIRSAGGDRYTYTILLTSRESREDKLEGLRAGADDFLTKPPDPDELAVRLEIAGRILAVHEVLREESAAGGAGDDRRADATQEPATVPRGLGAARGALGPGRHCPSRWSSSTSTASSSTTTPSATPPATRSSGGWRPPSGEACGSTTWWPATEEKSSS